MKSVCSGALALRFVAVALLASAFAGSAAAQNPDLPPTYGAARLNAGFTPDPFARNVVAGGPIQTNLGGVRAFVANAPDFSLTYTAGAFPLTFYVQSGADTTLLINLPDGTWVANDDGAGNLNPQLRFAAPQSGRYDIYVGTFNQGNPQATLFVTELK